MPKLPDLRRAVVAELAERVSVLWTDADTERLYRFGYVPGERLYDVSARPRERANVAVDNEDPARPRIVAREGVRLPGA